MYPLKRLRTGVLLAFCVLFYAVASCAEFSFSDTRFRDHLTTDNLDAIIEEYELYDGWYWTTEPGVSQDFHGHPDAAGWTSTAAKYNSRGIKKGWYGCRWPVDHVRKAAPEKGGYAECFAFAQFIGYLLSGEINPQHNWKFYYTIKDAGDLRVGDIVRVEYKKHGKPIQHSAVVYAVNGEEILFLQVSGRAGNRISVGKGFSDSVVNDARSIEEISAIPGLKISRYIPDHSEKPSEQENSVPAH